jgi:hypothetical protein
VAYRQLTLPPDVPRRVAGLIRRLEDHYFRDVHAMLRLPEPDCQIEAGCNFAIAQVLLSVVSGASVTLYEHSGHKGVRFRGVLEHYYPWADEPIATRDDSEHARQMYSLFRNPLTHDLGLDLERPQRTHKVIVKRLTTGGSSRGHSESGVEALETEGRPVGLSPVLRAQNGRVVLLVEAFYWGVRQMLIRLSTDHERMVQAEAFLGRLERREA